MTTSEILEGLNDDQKKVVLDYEGPCFVVAGPGSGKTHTVVSRTQYMIKQGINASSILLFTFTNKAAREIKNRIINKIGKEADKITVGTYHSVCARFLRKYANEIGFDKNFTIVDTDDCISIIKKIIKGTKLEHGEVMKAISEFKNKMITPSMAMQRCQTDLETMYANVYKQYQDELFAQDSMDFDDLIYYTILLFEHHPDILEEINSKYHYIVADEYHDSCLRDIRFIELLGGTKMNVCMILDDEQSIYSFRGADIDAVLSVQKRFEGLKTFILRRNYRSTQMIVNASRSMIKNNKHQIDKTIFTENETGAPIIYFEEEKPDSEALRVLKLVKLLHQKYDVDYKDIAILYRMSYLSRSIEDAFLKGGIPYEIIGGTSFYSRKEIKDILCYIRLMFNPLDFTAFKRAVNTPKRGVGEVTIENIYNYARTKYSKPIDFLRASREIKLKGLKYQGILEFNRIIDILKKHIETDTPAEFIKRVVKETDYIKMLSDKDDVQIDERIANINELCELATSFNDLNEFVENISLDSQINENNQSEDNDRVQMLTMHASKGLEWPAVIIIGANENIIPHWKAETENRLDEERRLFYVAMTRAEKYLFITRPKFMMQKGVFTRVSESRFIKEINKDYFEKYK